MAELNQHQTMSIEQVKDQLINIALKWMMIFIVPAAIAVYIRQLEIGLIPGYVYIMANVISIPSIYFYRHKLTYQFKGAFYVIFFLLLGILTLYSNGLLTSGMWWLILASSFSALYFNKWVAYRIMACSLLFIVIFGILFSQGWLKVNYPLEHHLYSWSSWLVALVAAGYILSNIVFSIDKLYTLLILSHQNLYVKNQSLNEVNLQLEEEIERRVKTEETLRRSENKFKALFISAGDAALVFHNEQIIDCNDRALSFFQCTREQLIGLAAWDLSPPQQPDGQNSKEKVRALVKKTLHGQFSQFEWLHTKFTGEHFDVEVSLSPIKDQEEAIMAILRDITAKKRAENALKDSEERYKRLSEASFEAIIISREGKIYDVNNQIENIYGYTPREFMQKRFNELVHPDDLDMVLSNIRNNVTERYVHRGIKKDGSVLYLEVRADHVTIHNQEYRLTVIRDITDYKKIELALRKSEEKFRKIFNSVSDSILIIDYNDRIQEVNDVAIKTFAYSRDEFLQMTLLDFIDDQYKEKFAERKLLAINQALNPFESKYITKSGKKIPVEVNVRKIIFDGKNAFIALFRNISERRQFQAKLYKAQVESEEKERARYAREIHDGLGPVLSTCKIYFHALKSIGDEKKYRETVHRTGELLEEALQSIKEISNNLSPHILRNYGLLHAVNSFIEKLPNESGPTFSVQSNFEDRLPELLEITIYRTLTELINNSLKYGEPTKISITFTRHNQELSVHYAEDGRGFDYREVIEQTRGFGLLNLENRIHKMNGTYKFDTSPGKGVNVYIAINLSDL